MNEASSKYVDQIAVEKLIQEKLALVHHIPDPSQEVEPAMLAEWNQLPPQPGSVAESSNGKVRELTFPSTIRTHHAENDVVTCRVYSPESSIMDLVFLHGLYEDNLQIYNFCISLLNEQGIRVYLVILPYHYARKPDVSAFSGEFFWSGNIQRSALAYKQAVYDVYQVYTYVRERSERSVGIVGFSMGGGIALSLAALTPLDAVFVINPVCNINTLVWTSTLFSTIRADLEAGGLSMKDVKARYASLEPLEVPSVKTDLSRVLLARSLYDQINDPANYDMLVARWGIQNVIAYKAGHLNILRVPKLASDVSQFCIKARRHELR